MPIILETPGCRAEVHPELGGRLGQLDLGGGPMLRGPGPGLGWTDWGAFPLAPWSNRLPGGHLRFGDLDADFPVNHSDGSALHGLVAARPWETGAASGTAAELSVQVDGGPYLLNVTQAFELGADHLTLTLSAANRAAWPVPVGIGIHPWFRRGPVRVPAEQVWPGEPLPTGPPRPVAGRHDLRTPTVPAPMDACLTGLTGSSVEAPGVDLHWEGPVTHVVVFSEDPDWVCVEPVTMANDGFRLAREGVAGTGVRVLAPGGSIEVRYRFTRPAPPDR